MKESKGVTEQAKVEEIARFLERYGRFEALWAENRLTQFKRSFAQLRSAVTSLQAKAREVERAQAPRFNVFRVLGVEDDEDRLHTPMLAGLLDPRGPHGQGTLFLHELLKQCSTKPGFPMPEGDIDSATWFVDTQRRTPFGELDLVVSSPGLRYLVVIENKVYAGEQESQLSRYHQWMERRKHVYDRRALVFLTRHGEEAVSAEGRPYFRLSYTHDVALALERSLHEVRAPIVLHTIRQYLDVVRRF